MRKKIDKILGIALIALMAFMTITVLWQVASRYINQLANYYTEGFLNTFLVFIGKTSSFTDELARYQLIWVGLLGAALVAGRGQHLAIDIMHGKLGARKLKTLAISINAIIIAFAVSVMVIGGLSLVYMTFHTKQSSSAMQLPLGYVYLVQPLSGLLISYYSVDNIIKFLKEKTEAVPVGSEKNPVE